MTWRYSLRLGVSRVATRAGLSLQAHAKAWGFTLYPSRSIVKNSTGKIKDATRV